MKSQLVNQLIHFLKSELLVPDDSIALAREHGAYDPQFLPMVLWQYGLLSLEQLECALDWLDTALSQLATVDDG